MLQSAKSSALRVARLAPRDQAIATIMASNWLMGRPIARRDAPVTRPYDARQRYSMAGSRCDKDGAHERYEKARPHKVGRVDNR
jgi:hypothetical protein